MSDQRQTSPDLDATMNRLQEAVSSCAAEADDLHRLAELGMLVGFVAHELSGVLTPLLGQLQLASEAADAQGKQAAIMKASRHCEKAVGLVEAIVGFARSSGSSSWNAGRESGSAGQSAWDAEQFDLVDLVNEVLGALASASDRLGITTSVFVAGDSVIEASRLAIEHVLLNLLRNAFDAINVQSGGVVVTRIRGSDADVTIEIVDNGRGMSASDTDQAFAPLFTKRSGQPGSVGIGMGLPFCRWVLSGIGGSVSLRSTPGMGTSATITIPRRGNVRKAA